MFACNHPIRDLESLVFIVAITLSPAFFLVAYTCILNCMLRFVHLKQQRLVYINFSTVPYAQVLFVSIGFPWRIIVCHMSWTYYYTSLYAVQALVNRILSLLSDEEGNLLNCISIPSIVYVVILLSSVLLICSIIFTLKLTGLVSITSP